ncbi:hypothetical protein [Flagellimonas sp.]|uniref:hypothetical protein n=1 Tax=Flagellimonas sp. TaxID=2058762 RepID=UPI003BB14D22
MKNTVFVLLIIMQIIACESPPLPSGIQTRVYGKIYDDVNQTAISNAKIRILEWTITSTFSGPAYSFKGYVDSTDTGPTGDYDIIFETTGKGNNYELEIKSREDVWFRDKTTYIEEVNLGGSEQIDFEALKLFPIKLIVKTSESFAHPILIYSDFPDDRIEEHPAFEISSERIVWLDKNKENRIGFVIYGEKTLRTERFVIVANSKTIETVELALALEDFN